MTDTLSHDLRNLPPCDLSFLDQPGRFIISAHQRPDGDAAGSVLGLALGLRQLGHEVWPMLHVDPLWLGHLPTHELRHTLPPDVNLSTGEYGDWQLLLLDSAVQDRAQFEDWHTATITLNLDHHDDNPRYGVNHLVDPAASSTCELVWRVLRERGVQWDQGIRESLWTGLITDTGGFQYEKSGIDSHLMAAELIAAGIAPQEMQTKIHGGMPISRLQLASRVYAEIVGFHDGQVMIGIVSQDLINELGLTMDSSEGLVQDLMKIEGVQIAALIKEVRPGAWKASLRSVSPDISVSELAKPYGGGHPRAAGLNWQGDLPEMLEWLETRTAEFLPA